MWLLAAGLVLCFLAGVVWGAPYLPTLNKQREQALDLLNLKPGQTVIDLGSGDGSFLLAAAKRGINAIGYEINPLLWLFSWLRCWPKRRLIKIYLGSYWQQSLPRADGLFVFLIERHMERLDRKLQAEFRGRVVSYAFAIPKKRPQKSVGPFRLYNY